MIYYVEDDKNIRDLIVYALRQTRLEAEGFESAGPFWQALQARLPDLILLDVMLPGEDGIEILRTLRRRPDTRNLPVMMLTAKGDELDRVAGLEDGADDYVTKPFAVMELIARIKAVMRRAGARESAKKLSAGGIVMNLPAHQISVNGQDVQLTYKEFELLRFLMEHRGMAFEREQLLDAVWGIDYFGGTRTIDVHIQTLRQKLGAAGGMIETVRGVGYRMGETQA